MSECPSIATIQARVAARFNVAVMDLRSPRRDRMVVDARHAAMCLCRELTAFSLPVIGRHFGGRDHTTVMYALRRMETRKAKRPEVARALSALADEIRAELKAEAPGPLHGAERDAALVELAAAVKRRKALAAELELLNVRIEEIGRRVWGATPEGVVDNNSEGGQ